jgi:ferredoxin
MRVKVDGDLCQGHNRCIATAPELFEPDELGYAHEQNEGRVPKELEEKARLAVRNCPERAINIVEE